MSSRSFTCIFACMLSLAAFSVAGSLPLRQINSMTSSEARTPREMSATVGIGLDLTVDYGTASLRFQNGTIRDIIKIDGEVEYTNMMRRFVDKATEENNLDARLRAKQAARWRRDGIDSESLASKPSTPQKSLGDTRSVTAYIHILSALIAQLRDAVERDLGSPVNGVVVSIPTIISLDPELLNAVITAAGLQNLYPKQSPLSAALASVASLQVLSKNRISRREPNRILILEYYPFALISSMKTISSGPPANSPPKVFLDHAAGSITRHSHTFSSDGAYWDYIRLAASRLPDQNPGENIHMVLLVGEQADNLYFAAQMKDLSLDWAGPGQNRPSMPEDDVWSPLYAAARGAAVVASKMVTDFTGKENDDRSGKVVTGYDQTTKYDELR